MIEVTSLEHDKTSKLHSYGQMGCINRSHNLQLFEHENLSFQNSVGTQIPVTQLLRGIVLKIESIVSLIFSSIDSIIDSVLIK